MLPPTRPAQGSLHILTRELLPHSRHCRHLSPTASSLGRFSTGFSASAPLLSLFPRHREQQDSLYSVSSLLKILLQLSTDLRIKKTHLCLAYNALLDMSSILSRCALPSSRLSSYTDFRALPPTCQGLPTAGLCTSYSHCSEWFCPLYMWLWLASSLAISGRHSLTTLQGVSGQVSLR